MKLEPKKVWLNRRPLNLIKNWRNKEWFYTGIYDSKTGVYISWYFVRVNAADQFVMTVFDPTLPEPIHYKKTMYVDKYQEPDALSLNHESRSLKVHYNGKAEEGWKFEVDCKDFKGAVDIQPTIPCFTKFDNPLWQRYYFYHFFMNQANGSIKAGDKSYELKDALVYNDHNYGIIPSKTAWHWLAAQNEKVALASLMNYGPNSQNYTEIFLRPDFEGCDQTSEWIRLEQAVSFECEFEHDWSKPWYITSTDIFLEVRIIQYVTDHQKIPPVIPFFVNLRHAEMFVSARGKVRINSRWHDIGEIFGVMEEQKGHW